jgi:putative aldouronate transport system substrate-binding protein
MKIRKDWVDKLGMKLPTTTDELYTVLKAFKEQDPGGVGKDKVVPFAMPAINQGAKGFFFGPMFGFGVNNDGPGNQFYAPNGNYKDGVFTSGIATAEGKAFFGWMNKLYKEGLLSKEFVTDINSQQYTQQINSGVAGFTDSNEASMTMNINTRKSVPTAQWVTLDPFKRADGTQRQPVAADYGMFIAVPKSSKNPEAVVKYLDWMAKPEHLATVSSGIKDVNWKDDGGLRVAIDAEANKKTTWVSGSGDLAIIQQGVAPYTKEQLLKLSANSKDYPTPEAREEYATEMLRMYDSFKKFGKSELLIDVPRPVAQKSVAAIEKSLYEGVSKAIIAPDYDKAYAEMISGWEKAGGKEYDKEITDAMKAMKK